jgi:hypothetical protein
MSQKFINNWSTTLTASALAADTVLTVATAEAAKLGAVSAEDFLAMTLDDGQTIEIVRCTGVSGGDLTVARAQEGTSAQDWSLGTPIECRLTAAALEAFASGAEALPSDLAEDPGTTAGLTWGYRAGRLRIGNAVHDIAADTVALTASATNYLELDPSDQTVKVNQSGFTPGRIPLREVTTDSDSQTASADKRAWLQAIVNAVPADLDQDPDTTTGLTWGWKAGRLRVGATVYAISADTIALTASATNYLELDPSDQTVKVNQSGFTAGRIPLREVTTDGSSQTGSSDKRAWLQGRQVTYDEGLVDDLDCADQVLSQPEIKDYAETRTAPSSSSGAITLDLQNGNVFQTTLTENITSLTIDNPPASGKAGSFTWIVKQDGTGSRTIAWPAAVKWAGGSAPTLSTAADAVDVLTFLTTDAGTTWYGFAAGLDLS